MRIKILSMLLLAILFFCSCSQKLHIEAVPSLNQVIDHKGFVTSELKHAVSISYYDKISKNQGKTLFMIIVENYGDKEIDISNDNISVIFKGNSPGWAWRNINLLSSSELLFDISARDSHQKDSTNFQSDDITAGVTGGNTSHAGESRELKGAIKRSRSAMLKYSLPRIVLKPQKIKPNGSMTGIFVCDTHEMGDKLEGSFKITVSIDGEKHEFTFKRSI